MYIYIYIYVYMYIYAHAYIRVAVHIFIDIHIYIYIYEYTSVLQCAALEKESSHQIQAEAKTPSILEPTLILYSGSSHIACCSVLQYDAV